MKDEKISPYWGHLHWLTVLAQQGSFTAPPTNGQSSWYREGGGGGIEFAKISWGGIIFSPHPIDQVQWAELLVPRGREGRGKIIEKFNGVEEAVKPSINGGIRSAWN